MAEVGMGVIDDLLATATQPPSFAVEDFSWGAEDDEAGWGRAPGSGEPTVPYVISSAQCLACFGVYC